MSYPHQPPPPKHAASSYSSASTAADPFNSNPSVQQLPYSDNPHNPYAQGGPNPGAGGAGVAPPGQAGQYAPYYDNEPEMDRRYEGGGMGRETWASESGWSQNGQSRCSPLNTMLMSLQKATSTLLQTSNIKEEGTCHLEHPLLPLPKVVVTATGRESHT